MIITSAALLLLAAPAFAATSSAGDAEKFCHSDQSTIVQRTNLRVAPDYFAKLYAVRNVATIISDGATYALDLDSGHLIQMEGTYDPVPTPDEVFLATIEYVDGGDRNGPHYFLSDALLDHPEPSGGFTSWSPGNFSTAYAYESIAWLPDASTGKYTYRFLCDNDGGQFYFRDDSFFPPNQGDPLAKYHVRSGKWIKACGNINAVFKLPMISKDGKQIAAFNTTQNVTQIYDLDDRGNCTNGRNLPFITGKADFSFDGNQVAFHMGRIAEPRQWFQTADPTRKLDTFVWDLQSKKLTRLTDVETGNAYFPTFKKNGQVGFLLQSVSAGHTSYSYVLSNPAHGVAMEQFPDLADHCNCKLDGFAELAAIGILKDVVCKSFHTTYSLEDESALSLTLSSQQCQDLLNKYWNSDHATVIKNVSAMAASTTNRRTLVANRLKTISMDDLLNACSDTEAHSVGTKVVNSTDQVAVETDPAKRLQNTCSQCHAGEHPASGISFDLGNIGGMPAETRTKMAEQIKEGNMPPGGLNESERETLAAFLTNPTDSSH